MVRFEPATSRKFLSGQLLWFLFWCAVTGIALYLTPKPEGHGTHTELGLPPCPSVMFFGRPCPGCGLTTSFTALVHGNIPFAFHAHPLGPFLYLVFTVTAFMAIYGWITRLHMNTSSQMFNRSLCALLIVFFAFGAVRFAVSSHYGDRDPYHQLVVNRR